jgi:hypothetical protein
MGLFAGDCPTCAVKDSYITYLQKMNSDLIGKLAEIASPGAVARQNYVQPKREEKQGPKPTHSPSRIAMIRKDSATPPEAIPQALRVPEADFEAR